MKTVSILRPATWVGVITLVLGMQAALAEPLVYVPLGGEVKIVVVDAAKDEIVDTISGVMAVHGLARSPDGQFLIAGSFEEREAGGEALAKPSGISEDEHAAHHGGSAAVAGKAGSGVSTVSVVRTADGSLVRRIDVPGAVHHVAVSPDGTRLASASNDRTVKVWDARPWTPELRAEAQARGLLIVHRDRANSLEELQANIRSDQTISDMVRNQALDWAELFWKTVLKQRALAVLRAAWQDLLTKDAVRMDAFNA